MPPASSLQPGYALVANGLFDREGQFHELPDLPLKPLEKLFQAKILQWLVSLNLLPAQKAQALRSWKHSGFNLHCGEKVEFNETAALEELAQYILRNPFSVQKMNLESPTERRFFHRALSGTSAYQKN